MKYTDQKNSAFHTALKEAGNAGALHSAAALSTLLGKQVTMHVPEVKTVSLDGMMELAGGSERAVAAVFLRILGDAPGTMFFVLPVAQAARFVSWLTGTEEKDLFELQASDMSVSAIQELGNILAGSYLTALSEFTGLMLQPTVPMMKIDMAGAILSSVLVESAQDTDQVLVLTTLLQEEGMTAEELEGQFFLLPDRHSFQILHEALGVGQ